MFSTCIILQNRRGRNRHKMPVLTTFYQNQEIMSITRRRDPLWRKKTPGFQVKARSSSVERVVEGMRS
jgi:hypothetical protein